MSLADAVKNGPRMQQARSAQLQSQIELDEAEAKFAKDLASEHRRKGQGDGIRAWYHRGAAGRWDAEAAKLARHANALRTELAKAKADEAAKHAKHVKQTVARAKDQPGQVGGPIGLAKPPSQPSGRRPSQPLANRGQKAISTRPKGHPMTVSGEAVNIEQTRANLDQLKTQVTDLRGSFEGMSGSLASGGLNQLAGSLASADDSLDSVVSQIEAAETKLADQEAIAEAAQAAGEMHTDTAFYG